MTHSLPETWRALLDLLSAPFAALDRLVRELMAVWRFDLGDLAGSLDNDDSI